MGQCCTCSSPPHGRHAAAEETPSDAQSAWSPAIDTTSVEELQLQQLARSSSSALQRARAEAALAEVGNLQAQLAHERARLRVLEGRAGRAAETVGREQGDG